MWVGVCVAASCLSGGKVFLENDLHARAGNILSKGNEQSEGECSSLISTEKWCSSDWSITTADDINRKNKNQTPEDHPEQLRKSASTSRKNRNKQSRPSLINIIPVVEPVNMRRLTHTHTQSQQLYVLHARKDATFQSQDI